MSVTPVFLACLAIFGVAYFVQGGLLRRAFALSREAPTPARALEDGRDFVPTRRSYLLGQHFSAITAAGPIVGPIHASLAFGWLPALLWVVLGAVLIGADRRCKACFSRHGPSARTPKVTEGAIIGLHG
jgi:carbon starvation protein